MVQKNHWFFVSMLKFVDMKAQRIGNLLCLRHGMNSG